MQENVRHLFSARLPHLACATNIVGDLCQMRPSGTQMNAIYSHVLVRAGNI